MAFRKKSLRQLRRKYPDSKPRTYSTVYFPVFVKRYLGPHMKFIRLGEDKYEAYGDAKSVIVEAPTSKEARPLIANVVAYALKLKDKRLRMNK